WDNDTREYHNFVDLDPAAARWLLKGCGILFLAAACWTCRTPTSPRESWRLAAEFSVVILGMLLFSERTWKHHCVTLLLPFGVLSYYLAAERPNRWLRTYLLLSLLAVFLLMSLTSTTLIPLVDAKMAQVYGAYVWGYLVLS